MKTIIYSPGDPAGIGPDLFLSLLDEDFFRFIKANIVCLGDKILFESRASELGYDLKFDFFSDINDVQDMSVITQWQPGNNNINNNNNNNVVVIA